MKQASKDIFKDINLPFETYFSNSISHETVAHDEMEIIWVLKGTVQVTLEHRILYMMDQTVLLLHIHQPHKIESSKDAIIISYRLKKEHILNRNLQFDKLTYTSQVFPFEMLARKYRQVPLLIIQIIKLLLYSENQKMIRYKILGYYTLFIYELYTIMLKDHYMDVKMIDYDPYLNRVHHIIEYMFDHFKEKITLGKLAKKLNISMYRLSHFITEAIGVPFREIIQTLRFEHALYLLKTTNASIGSVAMQSGFSDHKYLNKLMQERYHLTAKEYRKRDDYVPQSTEFTLTIPSFVTELQTCMNKIESDMRFRNLFEIAIESSKIEKNR